jgi:hypothetical protein
MSQTGPNPPRRPERSERDRWVAAPRVFFLLGLLVCGWAVYEYVRIDREEQTGLVLLARFEGVYDWGGKWAVAGFFLVIAAVFFAVSAWCWRVVRRLPRTPPEGPLGRDEPGR